MTQFKNIVQAYDAWYRLNCFIGLKGKNDASSSDAIAWLEERGYHKARVLFSGEVSKWAQDEVGYANHVFVHPYIFFEREEHAISCRLMFA